MCVYLRTKFQVSSIEAGEGDFTPEKNELIKSPPKLGVTQNIVQLVSPNRVPLNWKKCMKLTRASEVVSEKLTLNKEIL